MGIKIKILLSSITGLLTATMIGVAIKAPLSKHELVGYQGNLINSGTAVTSVTASSPLSSTGGSTPVISINTSTFMLLASNQTVTGANTFSATTTFTTTTIASSTITTLNVITCNGCLNTSLAANNTWTGLNTFNATTTLNNTQFIRPVPINAMPTSTFVAETFYEPQNLSNVPSANTVAMYSDDLNRILTMQTAANGTLSLHQATLNSAVTAGLARYVANNLQSISASTMGTGDVNSQFMGAAVYQGYQYVFVSSTGAWIMRATSTYNGVGDISVKATWVSSTISGRALVSTDFIIGVNAVGQLLVASSTTIIVPYTITTSTNTLTSGSPITCTGANILITNSRGNNNGLFIGFASAPFLRKFDSTCTTQDLTYGSGLYQAAPATTGPDLFVMKTAIYGLTGNTAGNSKIPGW